MEDDAVKLAQDVADRAKATTLGSLGPDSNLAIRRWDEAVRLWKLEKRVGAGPLLAEGVLFDCLGRLQGVYTRPVSSEVPPLVFADLAADRPKRAAKAFDAALKIDPLLVEARMRAARIRSPKDSRSAGELERLAADTNSSPFAYLAAMSRAEAAQAQHDAAGVIRWYERALLLHPQSTAATIALSSFKPGSVLRLDTLDSRDPYYTYPCTVLTPEVDNELTMRVRRVVFR